MSDDIITILEEQVENKKVRAFLEEYGDVVPECQTLTFLPRDVELQKEAVEKANNLIQEANQIQQEVVKEGDEEAANQLLALRCLTRSVRAELLMWIQLKKSNWDAAWHAIVDAQEFAESSRPAHPISRTLNSENHLRKLQIIEKMVFPPQVFNSPGLIVSEFSCSLCGENYNECDHLAGIPYWGIFCRRVPEEVEGAREVSVVDSPEDKKARITHFSTDDGMVRNRMTWEKSDPEESDLEIDIDVDEDSMTVTGVVMTPDNTDPIYELDEEEMDSN